MSKKEDKISKHKKYGFVYGIRSRTPLGKGAWIHLVEPKESTFPVEEGKEPPPPRYELTFLMKKSDPAVKAYKKLLEEQSDEMVELFNTDEKTGKPKKTAKITVDEVFKDGDEMDTDEYPFYAGHWYIVPKNKEQPQVYDTNVEDVEVSVVKGGMSMLLIVRPLCTAHGISFQLMTVQLAKDDGVRFAGGRADSKELLEHLNGDEAPFDEEGEEEEDDEDEGEEEPKTSKAAKGVTAAKSKTSQKGVLNLDKLA